MQRPHPGHRGEGQGLAEFALITGLVALAVIAALILLGTDPSTILSALGEAIRP